RRLRLRVQGAGGRLPGAGADVWARVHGDPDHGSGAALPGAGRSAGGRGGGECDGWADREPEAQGAGGRSGVLSAVRSGAGGEAGGAGEVPEARGGAGGVGGEDLGAGAEADEL